MLAAEEDPQALPQEIARHEALRDKLDAARRRLEAQAQGAGGGGAVRRVRGQAGGAGEAPGPGQGQASQAAGSRLPRSERAEQPERPGQPSDAQEQEPRVPSGLQRAGGGGCGRQPADPERSGSADAPATATSWWRTSRRSRRRWAGRRLLLADNGYANVRSGGGAGRCRDRGLGVDLSAEGRRRRHDFRPAKPAAPREPKAEWLKAMAEKLASEEGRASLRSCASRPSSRSSASSRRCSASPGSRCAASTR